jgi:WD40 repeat protein
MVRDNPWNGGIPSPERRAPVAVFAYKAFISYSHAADGLLAPALRDGLQQFARPWYRLRSMRVFRDETSLSNTPELWPSIEEALRGSEYFLLLASPNAARSVWVKREIEYWITHRSKDTLLVALTDGCLKWDPDRGAFDWTVTTALPPEVAYPFADEPRYTDLRDIKSAGQLSVRNPDFRNAVADIASTLLGRSKDELIGEDVRRHRQTKRIAWSAVIALLVLTAASIAAAYIAILNQREAERRQRLAQSRLFAAESERQRDTGQFDLSLLLALEAVRSRETFEARRALYEALEGNNDIQAVLEPAVGLSASGRALAFSPDGTLLAAAGHRFPVILWDVRRRRSPASVLTGALGVVQALDFSQDGRRLAAGDHHGAVLVWDVDSRQPAGRPLNHSRAVRTLAFGADGRTLATGGCGEYDSDECRSGEIRLWDLNGFEQSGTTIAAHGGGVSALAFSPDGSLMASGALDGTIILWDLTTSARQGEPLESGIGHVRTLVFSADGAFLAAVNEKGSYRRWRVTDREPLGSPGSLFRNPFVSLFSSAAKGRLGGFFFGDAAPVPPAHAGPLWAAQSDLLATTNKRGAVVLVTSDRATFPVLRGAGFASNSRPSPFAISGDRKTLAALDPAGRITLSALGAVKPGAGWDTHMPWRESNPFRPRLAFSPNDNRLAGSGCERFQGAEQRPPRERYWQPRCLRSQVSVWDVASHQTVAGPFSDHEDEIIAIAFASDGQTLTTYGVDGSRVIRRLATGEVSIHAPPAEDLELAVSAVSADGKRVAVAERDRTSQQMRLLLWNDAHRPSDAPRIWKRDSAVHAMAFDPVSSTLVLGGPGGMIDRWDPQSQQPISTLLQLSTFFPRSGTYEVHSLAFSPDATLIASNSDRTVIVWHLGSRQPLVEVQADAPPLFFSVDGRTLIAGTVLVDMSQQSWQRRACEVLGRNLSWSEWNLYQPEEEYRATCADIPLRPDDLLSQAEVLIGRSEMERGQVVLRRAVAAAADQGLAINETLCRAGGMLGLGELVRPACDTAVALCGSGWLCGQMRGHRGVARALAADLSGAAQDLQADADELRKLNSEAFSRQIQRRQEWIRRLNAGENPFDAATLHDLRVEGRY